MSPEQKIYENIESRLKNTDSFREKLYRKDYIKNWDVKADIKLNQELISQSLPDLLGFRINCFFWQDESLIYNLIKTYYTEGNFADFDLDFSENLTQKNGHTIYKLSGVYKKMFNFEIQIKSIMHNIWGEVEHKTIYKNREYDSDLQEKKAITEEIFNILQASDKQLVALFKKHNDKKQLIYALFYEETKKIVCECSGTDILANHYNAYFQLLDDYEIIKKYIASKLLEQTFVRVPLPKVDYSEEVYSLQNLIVSQFLEYNLKCLYYIYGLMHDVTSYEDFTLRFSKILIENFHDQEIQSTEYDEFDDAEETTKDYTVDILNLLEYKMGGRKKND